MGSRWALCSPASALHRTKVQVALTHTTPLGGNNRVAAQASPNRGMVASRRFQCAAGFPAGQRRRGWPGLARAPVLAPVTQAAPVAGGGIIPALLFRANRRRCLLDSGQRVPPAGTNAITALGRPARLQIHDRDRQLVDPTDDSLVAQNFIGCDRDQSFLMPPDVRDWLPEGHLAWFVLDAVAGMDLGEFYAAYRVDGVGRRAYDPAMLVALLLYGYARGCGRRGSSSGRVMEDVACKTIAMLETPDHATIARFVARHEVALAGLFGQVLALCGEAGLVRPGVVAIDGTRMAGNASRESRCALRRSRGRSWLRRRRRMRRRMSCMAMSAGMSCLSSCARGRGGRSSSVRRVSSARLRSAAVRSSLWCPNRSRSRLSRMGSSSTLSGSWRAAKDARVGRGKRTVSSSSGVGRTPIPSRARARSGCCSRVSGWRPSATRRSRPSGRMRITGSTVATRQAASSAADQSRGSRRRCLTGW